jgi:hypothetical protein
MAGKKGRSGTGPHRSERPWTDALRIIANHDDVKGKRKLLRMAEKTFALALKGDMSAVQEIGNRLDGKPAQESIVSFEKHDAAEWSRDELVALINDTLARDAGTAPPPGRSSEPDRVH